MRISKLRLLGSRACIGIAAGAVATGLAFAGCGGGSGGKADVSELQFTSPVSSSEPLNETINWALTDGEPPSLDYAQAGHFSSDTVVSVLCDNLLRMNPDFTISPGLAESWEQVDPTTLVYRIRPG